MTMLRTLRVKAGYWAAFQWAAFQWAALLSGMALAMTPAMAEEGHEAAGGLPQLDVSTYPTQIFWLAITFGVLLVLMWRVALPRVSEVLEARQEKIADDLDRAAALKAEAEAVVAGLDKALNEARTGAQKLLADAHAQADSASAQRQAELGRELTGRLQAAEQRIAAARDAAMDNIRPVAVAAAQAAVARLAEIEVDEATAATAVAAALKETA